MQDEWNIKDFDNADYHLRLYGPNGFYREFSGNNNNPLLKTSLTYERSKINKTRLSGNVLLSIQNRDTKPHTILVADKSYKSGNQIKTLSPGRSVVISWNLSKSYNWYDLQVSVKGYEKFGERFAGRVETGAITKTDPLMGRVV